MKKTLGTLSALLVLSTSPSLANSGNGPMLAPFLAVTSDASSTEVYYLGYQLDEKNQIAGIYYQNDFASDPAERLKSFSLSQINAGAVLIQKKNGNTTYDLLLGQTSLQANNTYTFTLDYLRSALSGSRAKVQFGVRYNETNRRFEAFQLNSLKLISEAKIKVNYFAGQAVGVDTVSFKSALRAHKKSRALKNRENREKIRSLLQ